MIAFVWAAMFVRTKGELRREKQEGAARNPSETTTSDKQSAHFTQCCCRREMFLCFCLTFSALHCNAPSLSAPFLCSSCRCPPPSLPPSPFLPFPPQPPQNHLFFSNQVQHLEEEEVPETAFVLCVRTDFRRVEARLRAAAMIRPK